MIGSNTTEAHPVLALRIKKAVRNGATLVVADPRAIWLTKLAKRHLQLRPGSDVWLLNALMHVILEEGLQDDAYIAAHCEDFEAVREVVARYTPEEAERVTGVGAEAIRATAREYATERHAAIFYTLGITEHACGVDNIWSLANLVLMTGHLGYESTGLNALRGQNNVQGLNDSGANPHYFPGYQPWDDPDVRAKFAAAWGVDLPERAGYRLDQMMCGLHDGRIKALYLVGENPAQTEPNAHHVEEGLRQLEFLVSQDLFLNETSRRHANVVLPAVELRREGRHVHEHGAADQPRPRRGAAAGQRARRPRDRDRARARARLRLARVPGRGVGLERARRPLAELVRDPLPAARGARAAVAVPDRGSPRGRCSCTRATPRSRPGRASSIPVEYQPPIEEPDSEYPFVLSTGRTLYHYNSATMTMREDGITDKQVEPFFEIAAEDASALGVAEGEWVRLVSRRGDLTARAQLSDRVYPGLVWMALHFAEARVNWLTHDVGDSLIGTPEYKVSAVRWSASDLARAPPRGAAPARPLRPALPLPGADRDDAADARRRAARGARRGHRGADRGPRPDGSALGGARGLVAARLDAAAAAARARAAELTLVAGVCGRGGGRARDRAGGADQVAERRHARPAQGRRRARRAEGRRRRARDRDQRQPAAGRAAADARVPPARSTR